MASQKTFREFLDICEARVSENIELRNKLGEDFELDEIAQVPAGKKLTYKGGEPLPPADKKSLQSISKMNRGIYPDPKPKPEPKPEPESPEQQTPRRNRFQFVDRSNASTQGNTRRGRGGSRFEEVELDEILMVTPIKTGKTKLNKKSSGLPSKPHPSDSNYVELMRKWVKAKQMQREEIENFDEGIGMTMANALGYPPPLSNRMKLKQALIRREIEKDTETNRRRRFSGRAADPNANTRRGPGARGGG